MDSPTAGAARRVGFGSLLLPHRVPLHGHRLSVGLLALAALGAGAAAAGAQVSFQRSSIDDVAGDVKLAGDIDLDGTIDLVIAGHVHEGLRWYHYPSWRRTIVATPAAEFTTDGALGDVDGDGDLDVVVPDGSGGVNLLWFENPARNRKAPDGDPFQPAQWRRRTIGSIGGWGKDVELADFDQDGRLDVAARHGTQAMIFFQDAGLAFVRLAFLSLPLGQEGMASGDLDGDGDTDLVVHGAWVRNPGGSGARVAASWSVFDIDRSAAVHAAFKALVHDVDGDGGADVLFSSSEATADVAWYRAENRNPTGTWKRTVIATAVERAHTLQAGDVDRDGTADVVVGQMNTAAAPHLRVFYNKGGSGLTWTAQTIDSQVGLHNGVLADVGGDGSLDVIGANFTSSPPLHVWRNQLPATPILGVDSLVRGQVATFRTTGCPPNAPTLLLLSPGGLRPPVYIPIIAATLGIADPILLAMPVAGANGVADFRINVPVAMISLPLWFQSLHYGASAVPVAAVVR